MGAEMYDEFGEHPSHNADSGRMPRPEGREHADATHRRIPEDSPARQARAGVARTHVSARDDDAAPSCAKLPFTAGIVVPNRLSE